jgi:hypothetical protein
MRPAKPGRLTVSGVSAAASSPPAGGAFSWDGAALQGSTSAAPVRYYAYVQAQLRVQRCTLGLAPDDRRAVTDCAWLLRHHACAPV